MHLKNVLINATTFGKVRELKAQSWICTGIRLGSGDLLVCWDSKTICCVLGEITLDYFSVTHKMQTPTWERLTSMLGYFVWLSLKVSS